MKMNRLVAVGAGIAMLAGCSKEVVPANEATESSQVSQISAFYAEGESKTVLGSDGNSVLWNPGDEISVYFGASQAKFTSINETPSDVSVFTSDKNIMFMGAEGSDRYIWGVYPYRADNAFDGSAVMLTVPATQTALAGSFAPGVFPSVGRSYKPSMGFYNVCGGIVFTVSQTGIQRIIIKGKKNEVIAGKVKVKFNSDGSPYVSSVVSGSKEVVVKAPEGGFQTGKSYFVSLLPVTFSSGFELKYDKISTIATYSPTKSVTVKRSVFAKLENKDAGLEWTSTGTDLSASATANCYIVNKAGTYKFKATVKGKSTESVGTPASAVVLWETFGTDVTPSKGDVIFNSVPLKDGYVYFSTPLTLNNGNAVIAVKDASGNILWSWHIWVCSGYSPTKSNQQTYYNSAGTLMDRNLGATTATKGDVRSLGLFYQWGRKDPFLGSSSISSNTLAQSTIKWPNYVGSDGNKGTIAYAISHPTTFIVRNSSTSSNNDWLYTGSKTVDNTRWQQNKSLYDPCPSGWTVPAGGLNGVWYKAYPAVMPQGDWDKTNKGMDFGPGSKSKYKCGASKIIWYPAAGYRNGSSGNLDQVGSKCICWGGLTGFYGPYAFNYDISVSYYVNSIGAELPSYGATVRCQAQ